MPVSAPKIAGSLCLGTAPDSWGVWFASDERQVPYSRFLDELGTSGLSWARTATCPPIPGS
jgi:inosose dehydratase